jgi:Predicted pPIWI-associating nuclease
MRLLSNTSVANLFSDPFEQKILRSAYSYLNNLHDPLRCNSFALVIRELIRIAIARIAPDTKVEKATWFVGYNDTNDHGKIKVKRKERYRFAVSGFLSDVLITKHPEFDVSSEIKELVSAIEKLSKYAHIGEGTYDKSDEDVDNFKNDIENAVIEYAERLEHTQKRIQERVWDLTQEELWHHIANNFPDDLDCLSTRSRIEEVVIEEMPEMELDHPRPILTGSGSAEVELNYGSRSDEQVSSQDSFPIEFTASINPDTLDVNIKKVSVDTSSFYD